MHSIRTKTMLLIVFAIVLSMTAATMIGGIAIRNIGSNSAEQSLNLLCEAGEKSLDAYFESAEKTVDIVSAFIETDLTSLSDDALKEHVGRASEIFLKAANKASGVLTYYYRIDPSVSNVEKGFWYTNLDGTGFTEHKVTDITLYDTEDTSKLVWYTVPKASGNPLWLPPYVTDNLDKRVISYNAPVYFGTRFVGVVGTEIDYTTMAEQVNQLKLYNNNGYAFLTDENGRLVYHPHMDVTTMTEDAMPKTPFGLSGKQTYLRYRYNGVEKQAARRQLDNGMWLTVAVPVSEITGSWQHLILQFAILSVALILVFIFLSLRLTRHISEPLKKLTDAAKQVNAGNYDVDLDYSGDDEVGILTYTFRQLIRYLHAQISDLNSLVYADALTNVRNKGAYDAYIRELQEQLTESPDTIEFAIGVFDCDNLKRINDQYGHDKGDIYLKYASTTIRQVFKNSPVFRTGGDEFAVILQNEDYQNRTELACQFEEKSAASCRSAKVPWEQVRTSMGIATYRPKIDRSVADVVRRADKLMYEVKLSRKVDRKENESNHD